MRGIFVELLERFPIQLNRKALQVFDFVAFSAENRCPPFRENALTPIQPRRREWGGVVRISAPNLQYAEGVSLALLCRAATLAILVGSASIAQASPPRLLEIVPSSGPAWLANPLNATIRATGLMPTHGVYPFMGL
jgi:hypothetical protein